MKKTTKEMVIGDAIKGNVYLLKTASKQADGSYNIELSDRSGTISGKIPAERWNNSYNSLIGGAVSVHAVVHVGAENTPLVKVKSLGKPDPASYRTADLFDGLSDTQIKAYKTAIARLWEKIPSNEIKQLVKAVLTKDTINAMSVRPASLDGHGRYMGGALAATAAVTNIAVTEMAAYARTENGIYHLPVEWSVLMGAGLLHMAAIPEYYTQDHPFRKTEIGVQRGYLSLLQTRIESAVRVHRLSISEGQLNRLLNTLASGRIIRSGVSPTSPEGHILRSALIFYRTLDEMSSALDSYNFKDGEVYTWIDRVGYAMEESAA